MAYTNRIVHALGRRIPTTYSADFVIHYERMLYVGAFRLEKLTIVFSSAIISRFEH